MKDFNGVNIDSASQPQVAYRSILEHMFEGYGWLHNKSNSRLTSYKFDYKVAIL